MTIPALGYPSRTAAVVALRAEGLSTAQIAERLGIKRTEVNSLEWRASHPRSARRRGYAGPIISIPPQAVEQLRPHINRRRMSLVELATQIITRVAGGGLVDQVLDGNRKERKG